MAVLLDDTRWTCKACGGLNTERTEIVGWELI
jgi:hypothetical protein